MKTLMEDLNLESSAIIKEEEINFLITGIENKMNKKIKKLKRIYQATLDGGDVEVFHKKCNYVPNTLVFIESEGHRRFGGFTQIPWKSEK